MNFIKRFFQTKYRIVHQDDWYRVQERCWFDLIYGKWWSVDSSETLEGAKQIIGREKAGQPKAEIVYEE